MGDTLRKYSETAFVNKLQVKLFHLRSSLQTLILLSKDKQALN